MSNKNKYISDEMLHEILKPYAFKAFKDLSKKSYDVIKMFYEDYDPNMYERTFGMKNLFSPSIKKTKNGYDVEFLYSVDFLTTEHNSNIDVFDGSFVHGYHGGKYAWGHLKKNIPRMSPSPWTCISTFVKTYKL